MSDYSPLAYRRTALHCLLVFALLLLLLPWSQAAASIRLLAPSQQTQFAGLQYQAGGHILAFQVGRAYLASLEHALAIEFVDSSAVMPTAEGSQGESGQAATLPTVTYRELWPGVTLTYDAVADGIAKSTYHVAAGADASQIRLRYNLPVSVQEDGSLSFAHRAGSDAPGAG